MSDIAATHSPSVMSCDTAHCSALKVNRTVSNMRSWQLSKYICISAHHVGCRRGLIWDAAKFKHHRLLQFSTAVNEQVGRSLGTTLVDNLLSV